MKFMLSEIRNRGIGSDSFFYPDRKLSLHAMVSSCGYQQIKAGDDYYWDGKKRGSASFFLWQLTLAGKGMLRYENQNIHKYFS